MKEFRYDRYRFNGRELFLVLGKGSCLIFLLSYLFYDSIYGVIALAPLLFLVVRKERKKQKKKRLGQLQVEFKDAIMAVSSALGAGYSVENAFREALLDMEFLYPSNHFMIGELQMIVRGIEMNQNIEELLFGFAWRSTLEDVQMFAEVFSVCKRVGGNLGTVIRDTASRISGKTEVYREIETFLSAKKFEQRIMNVVPLAILAYVRFTSPDFLNGLYGNGAGITVMTICLFVYGAAYLLSEKIMDIEI